MVQSGSVRKPRNPLHESFRTESELLGFELGSRFWELLFWYKYRCFIANAPLAEGVLSERIFQGAGSGRERYSG
jgi:hypothetical protein